MSFLTITACCATQTRPPIEESHKVQLLSCEEKMALITDVFLSAVVAAIAVGVILTASGLVNLGPLNAISSIGPQAAYIMLGAAGGIIVLNILVLLVKMSNHISHLFQINQSLTKSTQGQTLHSLAGENAQLQQHLLGTEAELVNLRGRVAELEGAWRTQSLDLLSTETAKQDAVAKLTVQGSLEELEAQLNARQEDLRILSKEVFESSQTRGANLERLKEEETSLKGELDGLRAEKARLEHDIAAAPKPGAPASTGDAELLRQVVEATQAEARLTALTGEITTKTNELAPLQHQILQLEEQKRALTEAVAGLEALKQEKTALEAALPGLREEGDTLSTATLPELRRQLDALKKEALSIENENAEKIKEAQSQAADILHKASVQAEKSGAHAKEEILLNARQEADKIVKSAAADAERTLQAAQAKVDALEARARELEQAIAEKSALLEEKAAHEEALKQTLERLTAELEVARSKKNSAAAPTGDPLRMGASTAPATAKLSVASLFDPIDESPQRASSSQAGATSKSEVDLLIARPSTPPRTGAADLSVPPSPATQAYAAKFAEENGAIELTTVTWKGENKALYQKAITFAENLDLLKLSFDFLNNGKKAAQKSVVETELNQSIEDLIRLNHDIKTKAAEATTAKTEVVQAKYLTELAALTATMKGHLEKIVAGNTAHKTNLPRINSFFKA